MPETPLNLVSRRALLTGTLATTALTLAACTGNSGTAGSASPAASASATPVPRTLRLAAAAPPVKFDPAIVADNESFRVTRQVYETLIDIDPDTGGAVAGLAEAWTESPDGLRYTFTLRQGVLFHDGTELNAKAVVANFNRWENLSATLRADSTQGFTDVFHFGSDIPKLPTVKDLEKEFQGVEGPTEAELAAQQLRLKQLEELATQYKTDLFEGKSKGGTASYFESVKATDTYLVTLNLRRRLPGLIEALTLPGMAIAAPSALTGGPKENPAQSLSTKPVGTGPYTFVSNKDGVVRLEIFKDYWNQSRLAENKTHPEVALISSVPSPYNREGALLADEIDGFDMVSVDTMRTLVRNAKVVVQRDPFSVLYLGMDQRNKWLAKPEFRMAIAHAVNRTSLAEKLFLQGSKNASTLLPSALSIPAPDETPNHDTTKAKTLLADLGYNGEEIEFAYPLRVSRNYLPLPERTFAQIADDLAAAGIRVKPRPIAWTDGYVQTVQSKDFNGLHLLGFSGGYRSADDFLSGILSSKENEFGYTSPLLDSQVMLARSIPAGEAQTAAYADILTILNADLPVLPLVFPISALAFNGNVTFYPPSPMLNECYADVQMTNSPSISS
ncbi:putative dipeptide/oligopeptide ABC transporter, substrate-binding protein [Glutamicibacter arilaitensis Re117]|uniref:Dipeptide/oligopeptide ABC transporter, substrate-binding protein n=1 Tax=Glutamicibacter arilaitensis (strain DSM 16368 / CIP 108037 / IAM 15318 / JCM 13566 / NCIMB 14258 / Re117) TaxID=861360 RepID=A0ABP1U267_GLUAR|nr:MULTISPECIES: ABC transporter substrate-binding protein [Glutamicibacter]CBT75570.1 putative dipeptide/oligopeptide ABC transporter, substrate-binding protein [Glutamicibacter arilaitensis Re117]